MLFRSLKPPFNSRTLLLWLAPVLCLIGVGYGLLRAVGRIGTGGNVSVPAPLTAAEETALRSLLKETPEPQ